MTAAQTQINVEGEGSSAGLCFHYGLFQLRGPTNLDISMENFSKGHSLSPEEKYCQQKCLWSSELLGFPGSPCAIYERRMCSQEKPTLGNKSKDLRWNTLLLNFLMEISMAVDVKEFCSLQNYINIFLSVIKEYTLTMTQFLQIAYKFFSQML